MSEKIIVVVSDRGNGNLGEISVVDDPDTAERLVERLLEAGFEQERIQVFAGRQTEFEVGSRPVVALVVEGEDEEPPRTIVTGESDVPASGPWRDQKAGGDNGGEAEDETKEDETEEEEATVRFSSLFRSA